MAEKTYQSQKGYHSLSFKNKAGEKVAINFTQKPKGHGEFSTSDPETQAYIEKNDAFKNGTIRVKWTPLEKAQANAAALRVVANKAEQAAKEAEAELAALQKPEKKGDEQK